MRLFFNYIKLLRCDLSADENDFWGQWKEFLGAKTIATEPFVFLKENRHTRVKDKIFFSRMCDENVESGRSATGVVNFQIPSFALGDLIHIVSMLSLSFFIFSYSYGQFFLSCFNIAASNFFSLPEYVSAYALSFVLPSAMLFLCTFTITYFFKKIPLFGLCLVAVFLSISAVFLFTIDQSFLGDFCIASVTALVIVMAMKIEFFKRYLTFLVIVMLFSLLMGITHAFIDFSNFKSDNSFFVIDMNNNQPMIQDNPYKLIATSSSFLLVKAKGSDKVWKAIQVKNIASISPD